VQRPLLSRDELHVWMDILPAVTVGRVAHGPSLIWRISLVIPPIERKK